MLFTDQLGRKIFLEKFPKRIISLVPSQTELLYDLGLSEKVVGITKFCIHPEIWFNEKKRVGGTKKINFDVIENLRPDLIIANKEENTKEEVQQLMNHYPVWVSDIGNLEDALTMIDSIGKLTNSTKKSITISKKIEASFNDLPQLLSSSAAYIIWNNPIMTVNNTRFIHDMLQRIGLVNVFADAENEYPKITKNQLKFANPSLILLSSEPFPFKQKHIDFYKEICPEAEVVLVNGEFFSWYGSRLQKSAAYFSNFFPKLVR